ncbi:MAG: Hsp20/alpha crystallin family protein [Anaerolineae bacterium]|nr:Hsp20/alpha crystallin family protein [Anaerolineae bacterium]
MTDLVRWEPFRDMMTLRDAMSQLFEESMVRKSPFGAWPFGRREGASLPAVDMYETEGEVMVKASLPGLKPEEVDITITGNALEIRGETKEETEEKRGDYYYHERSFGAFQRSLTLPVEIKADEAEATFENGVLTLKMPKAEQAKAKQIKIQAK